MTSLWLGWDHLPQMGGKSPELGCGCMASYEWVGKGYDVRAASSAESVTRYCDLAPSFREAWRCAHSLHGGDEQRSKSSAHAEVSPEAKVEDLDKAIRVGITEAFADDVSKGLYVNCTSFALRASFVGCLFLFEFQSRVARWCLRVDLRELGYTTAERDREAELERCKLAAVVPPHYTRVESCLARP